MIRPVVHIGYHKTATTWFQKAFYPMVENARFIPRAVARDAFLDDTAFRFDPAEAAAKLGLNDGEAVTLCEEGLSGYLHNGGLAGHLSKEMAHRIKAVLPDARIVVFIRSQPAIIAASYQQYVRGGGTFSFRRYAFGDLYLRGARREIAKSPRFTFDHFDYLPLIAHYRALFGDENVHVFAYEAFRRQPRAFLRMFSERLGLTVDVDSLSMRSSNRSYGIPTMWVVRLLNLVTYRTVIDKHYVVHIPYWYAIARVVGEALNKLPLFGSSSAPSHILGGRAAEWIGQRYWRSNLALMELLGLPLDTYGYPVRAPEREVPRPVANRWLSWMSN